jgi:biopolymer transport protein ExbD
MASIQVGGASSRKSLDSELPLVPFIDLLLCCVMFLLVAAVWNRLSSVEVSSPSAGPADLSAPAPSLTLSMSAERWLLVTSESARFEMPAGDVVALSEALTSRTAREDELVVAPDDGVAYDAVIAAIDVALADGIVNVSMAGDGAR